MQALKDTNHLVNEGDKMSYYMVTTGNGDLLCDGVSEHEIERIAELLNALRPFANIAADAALMADVLRGMRPHEAASLREALKTARLLVEQHGSKSDSECN